MNINCDDFTGRKRDICRGIDDKGKQVLTPQKCQAWREYWAGIGPRPEGDDFYAEDINEKQLKPLPATRTSRNKVTTEEIDNFIESIPFYPDHMFSGRGIVTCGGGERYLTNVWVLINLLRHVGCKLPIEVWCMENEYDKDFDELIKPLNAAMIDGSKKGFIKLNMNSLTFDYHENGKQPYWPASIDAFGLKCFAIKNSGFEEVIFLDADNCPIYDPEIFLEGPEYKKYGAIFWPDMNVRQVSPQAFDAFGAKYVHERETESGQLIVNKRRRWKEVCLVNFYNEHRDYFFKYVWGDKELWHMAWRKMEREFAIPIKDTEFSLHRVAFIQHDFDGKPFFHHRVCDSKWKLYGENKESIGYPHHEVAIKAIYDLRKKWNNNKKQNLAVCTFAIGDKYKDAVKKGMDLWKIYCEENQVPLYIGGEEFCVAGRDACWGKLEIIKKHLRNHQWILYVDADTVPMLRDWDIHALIEKYSDDDTHIILGRCGGGVINAGVMLLKNNKWTFDFINLIEQQTKYFTLKYTNLSLWDNAALLDLWETNSMNCRCHIKVFAGKEISSYAKEIKKYTNRNEDSPQWYTNKDNSPIIHISGIRNKSDLKELVNKYASLSMVSNKKPLIFTISHIPYNLDRCKLWVEYYKEFFGDEVDFAIFNNGDAGIDNIDGVKIFSSKPELKRFSNEIFPGFYRSMGEAFKYIKNNNYRYVSFLDSDIIILPHAKKEFLDFLYKNDLYCGWSKHYNMPEIAVTIFNDMESRNKIMSYCIDETQWSNDVSVENDILKPLNPTYILSGERYEGNFDRIKEYHKYIAQCSNEIMSEKIKLIKNE